MKRKSIIALLLLAATCFGQNLGDTKLGSNGQTYRFGENNTWELDTATIRKAVTTDIEAGFFTMASANPKVAFRDTKSDSYRDLYGELVHPIRLDDRRHLPNVVVISVAAGAGAGGTDRLAYVDITDAPMLIDAASHGLTGILYVDKDGELTSDPPTDTFRRVEVGRVIDANTLLLSRGKSEQIAAAITKSFRAHVRSEFEYLPSEVGTAISDITINNGSAQIWRDDAVSVASPTAAQMLEAITDKKDADELRFNGDNTGFTIDLSAESYVSDVWLQLARQTSWKTEPTRRTKLEVLAYPTLAAVTPSKTVVVWDTAVEPIPESGIFYEASLETIAAKIEVRWSTSTGIHDVQGSLAEMRIYGKKRLETIQVTPGGPPIPYDDWDIIDEDKAILCSNRWMPGQHAAQIGVEINVNEVFMNYVYGWGQPYDTSSSTLATTVNTDQMDDRGYFNWARNGFAKYNDDLQWLSIDIEYDATHNTGWTYHPDDNVTVQSEKTARWQTAYNSFRNITVNKFVGPYTHPQSQNRVGLQGYFRLSGGGGTHAYYRRALERETFAEPLYGMSDYMCPPIYDVVGYTKDDWIMLCEHFRDMARQRGKLCIPHISARNFSADTLVADYDERLQIASDIFDGWMIFESRTDNPHSEADKLVAADAYRTEIDRLQTSPVPTSSSRKGDADSLVVTSGTETIDFDAGSFDNKIVTVTGAYSPSWTPTRIGIYSLTIVMDGTGGHTVTLPTMVGTPPTIDTTANESTEIIFFWNGSESVVVREEGGGGGSDNLGNHTATTTLNLNSNPITNVTTVDGRDVSVDGTKLDGIAANANNYVHPNHTGDVTSVADGATTISAGAVDLPMLSATGTADDSKTLRGDNTWSLKSSQKATTNSVSGTATVDWTDGTVLEELTLTGNTTISIAYGTAGVPASGQVIVGYLKVNFGGFTPTFDGSWTNAPTVEDGVPVMIMVEAP